MVLDRILDSEVSEFYNGIIIVGPRSWVNKQMQMLFGNDTWKYVDYNANQYIGPKSFVENQIQLQREKTTGQYL